MKALWNFIWKSTVFVFILFVGLIILAVLTPEEANDTINAIGGILYMVWTIVAFMYAYKIGPFGRKKNESVESVPQSPTAELVNSEAREEEIVETLEEFLAELAEIEKTPLPADAQDENADQFEEEEIVEQDNEQKDEEVARDFDALVSQFGKEEKFILMVGLLALYGDGELSPEEVYQFKKTIKALDFKPASLTHRDPSDQALCLNETLAWSLSFIRTNFADAANLSYEDVIELFNALTTSIETDIKKAFPEKKQQLTYSIRLKKALTDIAKADGKLSKGEKKLIKKYDKTSNL